MKKFFIAIAFATAAITAGTASAQSYQLSSKSYEMTWPKSDWNGYMGFPKVYCAQAPSPERAQSFTQSMFNGNAIYVGKILYPDNILLAVVFSSLPTGRSAEDDTTKQLTDNKATQARANAASLTYEVAELPSQFGSMIGVRINNIESDTPSTGPFPLAKKLIANSDGTLTSMSVHRLFAKGKERFEIAAMQMIPQASRKQATENEVRDRLNQMVEQLTASLQTCTGAMPERSSK